VIRRGPGVPRFPLPEGEAKLAPRDVLARLPTSRAKNDFGIELYRIYRGEIFISSRRELKKFPDLARGGGEEGEDRDFVGDIALSLSLSLSLSLCLSFLIETEGMFGNECSPSCEYPSRRAPA